MNKQNQFIDYLCGVTNDFPFFKERRELELPRGFENIAITHENKEDEESDDDDSNTSPVEGIDEDEPSRDCGYDEVAHDKD